MSLLCFDLVGLAKWDLYYYGLGWSLWSCVWVRVCDYVCAFLLNIEDILRELLVKILDVLMPYQFQTIIHSHPLHLDPEVVVGI